MLEWGFRRFGRFRKFRGKRCPSACGAACKREEKFRACENKTLSASRIVAYCAQSSIFTSAKNYEFARWPKLVIPDYKQWMKRWLTAIWSFLTGLTRFTRLLLARYENENLMRKIIEENRERGMGNGKRERVNVRMLECLDWKQLGQLIKTTFKRCAG